MNYFNKEQMEFLSKYEDVFNTAVFGNFKHSTNVLTDKKIGEMYTNVTGETLSQWSCNTCNLKNYISIGKLYFATKKYLESNENRNKDKRAEGDDGKTKNRSNRRPNKKRDAKRQDE